MTSQPPTKLTDPEAFIADHIRKIPRSGIRDFFELVQGRKDVISLGIGEPDFITPWHIREATIYALEQGKTSYTSNLGLLRLRKAISQYVEKNFRISYHPDNEIIVTVGVSEAIDLALRAILNPGDEILYHQPCYVSYNPSILLAHGVPVPITTSEQNDFSLKADDIKPHITPKTKALLLNFPTNPTGAILPKTECEKIAKLCQEHDLLVITDEVYAELSYETEHVSIASIPGMRERTIFLHGLSKAYAMTGFRIGYACAPPALTEAMMRVHQYSMLCASIISQEAAIEALENGSQAMEKMKSEYHQRRNFVVHHFNRLGLHCFKPQGAFYVFPSVQSTKRSSRDFAHQLLEKENVAVVPGNAFGDGGEGFIRCSYATSLELLKVALNRIENYLSTLSKTST